MAIDLTAGDFQAVDTAQVDRVTCLLGTATSAGAPQISPKGSMMVFDGTRLAYWERAGRSAIANIKANSKVVVYYRNPGRKLLWRFYGNAEAHPAGALCDAVWSRTIPDEREKDPDKKGMAVVIDVTLINDLSGKVIQQA
jgi:general stress protein 26